MFFRSNNKKRGWQMAVVNNDPLDEFISIQEQMNRFFDPDGSKLWAEESGDVVWQPTVDIYEDNTCVILKIDLPGIDREDIRVTIEDNILTLQGKRKLKQDIVRERYHRLERYYGPFQRNFTLPHSINKKKVSASCDKGVLTIILPKNEETLPRQIDINIT